MLKVFCDICKNEIRSSELVGRFESMEIQLKGNGQPTPVSYDLCQDCKGRIKNTIFKMIEEEQKDG